MRRLFARHRSVYPLRSCHFCCVKSYLVPPHPTEADPDDILPASSSTAPSTSAAISTGTIDNWFCSSCQCWNRTDASQEGGMVTWEQKMHDERQNVASLQKRAMPGGVTTGGNSPTPYNNLSPFCRSCQTNQTLILSIMANGDADQLDKIAMQEWKASLERRYPPLCSKCEGIVQDRIQQADKMARRLIWHGWLSKRDQREKRREVSSTWDRSKGDNNVRATCAVGDVSAVSLAIWTVQTFSFLLSFAIPAAVSIRTNRAHGSSEQGLYLAAILGTHLLCLYWDPTLPWQQQLRKGSSLSSTVRIEGRERLRSSFNLLLAIRCLHLAFPLEYVIGKSSEYRDSIPLLASSVSVLAQFTIAGFALSGLRVSQLHSISLRSRTPPVSLPAEMNGKADEPPVNLLSLDTRDPMETDASSSPRYLEQVSESNAEIVPQEMDWSPTIESKPFRIGDDFQLGPQRFFAPDSKTGLEELLNQQLALGEGRKANPPPSSKSSIPFSRSVFLAWWAGISTMLLVCFVAMAFVSAGQGSDILLGGYLYCFLQFVQSSLAQLREHVSRTGKHSLQAVRQMLLSFVQ